MGYYPIFIKLKNENEKDIFEALDGIIDRTINIASYYSLKTGFLPYIKKLS